MTHPQFWKFKNDWDTFKHITAIPSDQITAQLYNLWDNLVQNSIIGMFQQDVSSLLQVIKNCYQVLKPNCSLYAFREPSQTPTKSIHAYLIRLKSAALD